MLARKELPCFRQEVARDVGTRDSAGGELGEFGERVAKLDPTLPKNEGGQKHETP